MNRFENLVIWQRARRMCIAVRRLTRGMHEDRELAMQMRRAALSVVSNIAEGSERAGSREFRQFLVIARASCGELRAQLYLAGDYGYLDQAKRDAWIAAMRNWAA